MKILIRCDASQEIGFGHVVRCLALADELRNNFDRDVFFLMRGAEIGFQAVREKGYPVIIPEVGQEFDYQNWVEAAVNQTKADVLIMDVRDDLPRSVLIKLKSKKVLIVTIDDPSERRLDADLAFYPPVPQVKRFSWDGFSGKLYHGWEWVILRPEFARDIRDNFSENKTGSHAPLKLLVAMGGSDPAGLTLKAVKTIDGLTEDFVTIIVLGRGFCHDEALNELLSRARRRYEILRDVKDMASLMAQVDMAVASFCVTAYELAAMGVPAVYLCLSEDHAESATSFVDANIGMSLGVHGKVSEKDLAQSISSLLNNPLQQLTMGTKARQLIDGRGAQKIAQLIGTEVEVQR